MHLTHAVVVCGMLSNPQNGSVSVPSQQFGSVATYSCETGLVIEGNSSRQCESDGNWSGEMPTCVRKHKQIYIQLRCV